MRLTINRIPFSFVILVCVGFAVVTTSELNAQWEVEQKKQPQATQSTQRAQAPQPQLPEVEVSEDPLEVKTALQFVGHLASPHSEFEKPHYGTKLSDEEKDKAVQLLRQLYPFVSLRERLGSNAVAPNHDSEQISAKSLLIPASSRAEPVRVKALRELHSKEVRDFISRPGAGFGRSIMRLTPSPYSLRDQSSYAVRLRSGTIDSDLRGEPTVELESLFELKPTLTWRETRKAQVSLSENGMPTNEMSGLFHQRVSGFFASSFSNGLVNSVDQVAGFRAHRVQLAESWSESIMMLSRENIELVHKQLGDPVPVEVDWKLNRMQLVSLLLHDDPQVYISENLPDMEELSGADAETRDLDVFEAEALKRMLGDENVITRATPNRVRMMGSLRATQDCMKCHAVKENELLGAFTYEFLRDPRLNLKPIEL